jgi:DNA-binding winged helix-turn-helix (wHTH) protein
MRAGSAEETPSFLCGGSSATCSPQRRAVSSRPHPHTMSNPVPAGSYRFGPFRLDPASRVLDRDGRVVPLAPRTFDVLHTFVRSGGRLLTKHELLASIWDDVNVEEASLAFQVSTLRKTLGEPGTAWIETVPKHGYRFTAPVREVLPEDTRTREVPSTPPATRVRPVPAMWPWVTGLVVVVAAASFVAFRYTSRPMTSSPVRSGWKPFHSPATPGGRRSPRSLRTVRKWRSRGTARDQDNYDIYVKAIGAEQPLRLTSDRARDGSPAWSPDGTRIAFLRDKPGAAPKCASSLPPADPSDDRGGAESGPPGAFVVCRRPIPGRRGSIVA